MNRRGNLGVLLTPFIAFILIVMALFNMVTFNGNLSDEKASLNILNLKSDKTHDLFEQSLREIVNLSIENSKTSVDFVKSFNESFKNLASEKRGSNLGTNLYAKIALGEYLVRETTSGYEIIVSEIFEDYAIQNNELRYFYSIRILFDKQKVISVDAEQGL